MRFRLACLNDMCKPLLTEPLAPWSGQRNEPQPGFGTASLPSARKRFFARYSQIEPFGKQLDYTADECDLILLKSKPIKLTKNNDLAKKAPAQPDQQCEIRLRRIRARGHTDDRARDQWPRLRSRRRHRQRRRHSTGESDPHFSDRFTTRVDGRGFGLHIAVLAAQEMGGSLTRLVRVRTLVRLSSSNCLARQGELA